ncbi:MAG: ankyrin repeat domain-containing protein [Verrucomicrobia bacterium]|nr:ankyrin repeat domain-containing protein [Verrucomicrobiota bacterium]
MAHAEGWIEAYEALEAGRTLPADLLSAVLANRNGLGESMLHWYAIEGEPAVLEKIIGLGFDVNATNDFGRTALFECVVIDRWEAAELLLTHRARTDIRDQNDEDVLAYLDEDGRQEKARKLQELTRRIFQRRATPWFEFGLPTPPWMVYSLAKEIGGSDGSGGSGCERAIFKRT